MSEQAPSGPSPEYLKRLESIGKDRGVLDAALERGRATNFFKHTDEGKILTEFTIQILVDVNSGRVRSADASGDRELLPDIDEARVDVQGNQTLAYDSTNRLTEEDMIFTGDVHTSGSGLSDIAITYVRDLIAAWREAHNRFIGHPTS